MPYLDECPHCGHPQKRNARATVRSHRAKMAVHSAKRPARNAVRNGTPGHSHSLGQPLPLGRTQFDELAPQGF
jgi:hypothetical protein